MQLEKLYPKIPRWDKENIDFRKCPSSNCATENPPILIRPDGLSVAVCRYCGLIYLPHIPNDKQLSKFYKSYWDEHKHKVFGDEHAKYIADNLDKLPWEYAMIKSDLISFYKSFSELNILEIGFGDGHFLKSLEREGANVFGLEMSPQSVEFVNSKLDLEAGLEDFMRLSETKWDVIVMKDIIEHVPFPADYFAKAETLLKPNGRLVLWTPNGGDDVEDILNDGAIVLRKDLEHLQYYNSKSIAHESFANSFVIEHFETIGLPHYNWIRRKESGIKKILRYTPFYETLNMIRRSIMKVDKTKQDIREGKYNLFCILRKSTPITL